MHLNVVTGEHLQAYTCRDSSLVSVSLDNLKSNKVSVGGCYEKAAIDGPTVVTTLQRVPISVGSLERLKGTRSMC